MKTNEVDALIAKAYTEPQHAVFFEVPVNPDSTGRRIDALAIALWRSKAFALTGFEVKVSRSDWLRELKDPSKSDALFKYCDYFYVVAPQVDGKDIIKPEEIPENWGYKLATPKGLRSIKKAPRLSPAEMPKSLMISILRREGRRETSASRAQAEKSVRDARAQITEQVAREVSSKTSQLRHELALIKNEIVKFEEATGIPLSKTLEMYKSRISAKDLGETINFINQAGIVGQTWMGPRLQSNFANLKADIEKLGPIVDAFLKISPPNET